MKIGSHVSMSKGLLGAVKEAVSYDANTFMIYTGAPQNTRRSPIDKLKVPEGQALMKKHNIEGFVVHAPYLINLASYKENIFELATSFLKSEIYRTIQMGSKHLVLHPGAYTDKDAEYGINRIAEGLNEILEDDMDIFICLETMSGKGTEIGRNFSELQQIIEKVNLHEKIKICFDTCHAHDSGYDIVNDFDGVMKEFDDIVGAEKIEVFHLNGSLNVKGAKKDRHANFGADADNPKGEDKIGAKAIHKIAHSKYADGKFLILETPWLNDTTNLYKEEIAMLRKATYDGK